MSERPRNPKLEVETNVPVTVTIGKMFYKGNNEHGEFYGYNLTANGSEHVFFASPFVHERFQAFGQGTTVKVVKRQKAGQKSIQWEIGEANGSAPTQNSASGQAKPKYEASTFNREAYREQRVERMHQAYVDAVQVRDLIGDELTSEDLRSIAISFVIEENRDRVPLNPVEKPPDANIPALLEEIKKALTDYIPGESDTDKTLKAELLDHSLATRNWQVVTQMNGERLIEGLATLKARIEELKSQVPQDEDDGIPF